MIDSKVPIVGTILDRMKTKGELPAMGRTVSLVNSQTNSNSKASVEELTNTILDDFALTNKLLRLVNSASYVKYHGGGKINTVSRAINILGFDHVRDVALSLILVETIKNDSFVLEFKESIMISLMSGVIAKRMGRKLGIKDIEEAFICSMFHTLGRLLVIYYLPDEHKKIVELARAQKTTENETTVSVLNATYEAIGMEIARYWNFSEDIVYCMQKVPIFKLDKPKTSLEAIRCLSIFSNSVCELVSETQVNVSTWKETLNSFNKLFANCDDSTVNEVLDGSLNIILTYCADTKFNIENSNVLKNLGFLIKGRAASKKQSGNDKPKRPLQILDNIYDSEEDSAEVVTPEDILTKGVLEIASTLLENFTLNDILHMILEVLYRGMEFTHAIISIKSANGQYMDGRFGFGRHIESLVKKFRFQIDKNSSDVFNISLNKDSIVIINNVDDVEVQSCIPNWLQTAFNVNTFILIPITLRKSPIGLIYGDWAKTNPQATQSSRLRYVKMIRNQAMLAIKQAM
ncbi:MAG: HDOD domain-containing protein [Nitrospirae bacterium]|nr:HDOD domain-containing protein [Nitrospirota bacterium]